MQPSIIAALDCRCLPNANYTFGIGAGNRDVGLALRGGQNNPAAQRYLLTRAVGSNPLPKLLRLRSRKLTGTSHDPGYSELNALSSYFVDTTLESLSQDFYCERVKS